MGQAHAGAQRRIVVATSCTMVDWPPRVSESHQAVHAEHIVAQCCVVARLACTACAHDLHCMAGCLFGTSVLQWSSHMKVSRKTSGHNLAMNDHTENKTVLVQLPCKTAQLPLAVNLR